MPTFPNYKPDASSTYENEPRSLRANFGDGYSQAVGDGLNPYSETWNLRFSNRPKADVAAIKAFLDTVRDVTSFDWTAPDDTASKKWICEGKYTITEADGNTRSISCTVKRWFGA